jgi:hypothetical protein
MNSRISFCIIALAIVITNPGCSPSKKCYPVDGAVAFEDGASIKDLVGGVVSFESVADQLNASGDIDEHGRYRLKTPNGTDVPAGRYRVLVMPPEPRDPDHPPPPVLPERYRSYADSGIEVIVEEKANHIPINLCRK